MLFRSERFQVPPDWQPGSGADYSDPHAGFGQDYSDFFESLFGAAGRSQQGGFARRGRDIELELPLFLEESQAGSTKPLSFSLPQREELGRRVGETTKTLNVKIPAGSTDGERIRLKGQGEPGIGGAEAICTWSSGWCLIRCSTSTVRTWWSAYPLPPGKPPWAPRCRCLPWMARSC